MPLNSDKTRTKVGYLGYWRKGAGIIEQPASDPAQAPIVGVDAGGRMQRETAGGEAQEALRTTWAASDSRRRSRSPADQLSLDGGGRQDGLQGLRLGEFVDLGVVQ